MPLSATERFSDRADAYVRGRPTYPQAIVEQLQKVGALKQGQTVVDLGVGTGLSAEPFLRSGYTVIGVEPNAADADNGRSTIARVFHSIAASPARPKRPRFRTMRPTW